MGSGVPGSRGPESPRIKATVNISFIRGPVTVYSVHRVPSCSLV